jgi:hypothetical protein
MRFAKKTCCESGVEWKWYPMRENGQRMGELFQLFDVLSPVLVFGGFIMPPDPTQDHQRDDHYENGKHHGLVHL